MTDATSSYSIRQLVEIEAKLGRKLKVLHIGNIANNAYNNARIQQQYGIEADVICCDYYHVMATPEWEDGGLTTRVDPVLANWWESNLKGFRRPEWYVQGPVKLCLAYLDAHRRGAFAERDRLASALEESYVDRLHLAAISEGRKWFDPRPKSTLLERFGPSGTAWRHLAGKVRIAPLLLSNMPTEFLRLCLWPILHDAVSENSRTAGSRAVLELYHLTRRVVGRSRRTDADVLKGAMTLGLEGIDPSWPAIMRRIVRLMRRGLGIALTGLLALPQVRSENTARSDGGSAARETKEQRRQRAAGVAAIALREEPAIPEEAQIRADFVSQIADNSLLFGALLEHYDIVQGYAIDGLVPLANGVKAFASYEHGTLRDLPFERSLAGLVCRVVYKASPAVFVTNSDVLPSVERLGLKSNRVHYLPHAFDEQKLMRWRDENAALEPPNDVAVFFSPSRQHWRDSNPSLTKGNDVMMRAAGRLWREGRRFRLIMVEWGYDVEASKCLIEDLGCSGAVQWVPPMGKQDLWRTYCTSHAVLDQFTLPALGGVGFEALALGRRLLTRVDGAVLAHFFGAAPPVLPASSEDEVAASMARVIDDLADAARLGASGRRWISEYHSARRTVEIQAKVYVDLLNIANAPVE